MQNSPLFQAATNGIALAFLVVLLVSMIPCRAMAQAEARAEVTTSKSSYEYGDTIQISFTVTNEGHKPFTLPASSTCQAQFVFNDFESQGNTLCTGDGISLWFSPGASRTWIWSMPPEVYGFPASSGEQTIIGYYPGYPSLADTVVVQAEQYRGGQAYVGFLAGVTSDDVSDLRDSLNVTVIEHYDHIDGNWTQLWQVEGVPIDTVVRDYASDPRIRYIEPNRMILYSDIVVVSNESSPVVTKALKVDVFPNPATYAVSLAIEFPNAGPLLIEVFDIQGRRIAEVLNGFGAFGRTSILYDVSDLASGAYLFRVTADGVTATHAFIVAR